MIIIIVLFINYSLQWERKEKGKGQPFPFIEKRTWPHLHCIFFSSFVWTFYHLCLCHISYTLSLTHTPFALFFFSFHISSTFIHLLSSYSFLSQLLNTTHGRAEDRRGERERHTKSKREKGPVVLFKKFAASSSSTLSLLLSFAEI